MAILPVCPLGNIGTFGKHNAAQAEYDRLAAPV
jgi:hypothetical protein